MQCRPWAKAGKSPALGVTHNNYLLRASFQENLIVVES